MDLYFERWDGQATTMEAFIQCFAERLGPRPDAPSSPGTSRPARRRCRIEPRYDAASQALELILQQATAPTPGQPDKRAAADPDRRSACWTRTDGR